MVKAHASMRANKDMWVCGRMIFNMDMVSKQGMMVPDTMEILWMAKNKVEEHTPGQMGNQICLFLCSI